MFCLHSHAWRTVNGVDVYESGGRSLERCGAHSEGMAKIQGEGTTMPRFLGVRLPAMTIRDSLAFLYVGTLQAWNPPYGDPWTRLFPPYGLTLMDPWVFEASHSVGWRDLLGWNGMLGLKITCYLDCSHFLSDEKKLGVVLFDKASKTHLTTCKWVWTLNHQLRGGIRTRTQHLGIEIPSWTFPWRIRRVFPWVRFQP